MADEAVKVCVRIRPLIEREETAAAEKAQPVQLYWKAEKKSIQQIDDGNPTKSFGFDRVFSAEESTDQLYQDFAKPLVSAVEGYNGTIIAYGQTSSGKTFTMMGSEHAPGVIPLAMEEVFRSIEIFPKKEFLLRVSYMEICDETVNDLLVDSWKGKHLQVCEKINKNIYVPDLTEELVNSPAQVLAWIQKGEKNRRLHRSHTIFRMILESSERNDLASGENADAAIIVSHLNLVDLAGSERASQTGAQGTWLEEGCDINRSLFTLGQVIEKLSDESQSGFLNYRDSKLTLILANSLGGNAKTVIICTITPVALDETLSTLQFASAAQNMKNEPHVTEVSDDGTLLKRYRHQMVDLKWRLQEVSSVIETTATEKEDLAQLLQEKDQLQREIRNLTEFLVTSANSFPVQEISAVQEQLKEEERLNVEQQAEEQQEAQQTVQQMEKELQTHKAQAETSHQLLCEANSSISVLKGQLGIGVNKSRNAWTLEEKQLLKDLSALTRENGGTAKES
ncbi:centromere-associated protein E-like [Diretmus argenteus]